MADIKRCDGCGQLGYQSEMAISGCRADGMVGCRPLPNDSFDWCINCALVAFAAVWEAGGSAADIGDEAPMRLFEAAQQANASAAQRPRRRLTGLCR